MSNVRVTLEVIESDLQAGILQGEDFQIKVSFEDVTNNNLGVISGYVDINFDPEVIQVNSINYAELYQGNGQTGTIENTGIINEVGSVINLSEIINNNQIILPENNTIFTLNVTALKDLTENITTITTDAPENIKSEITILGNDNDQRNETEYGELIIGNTLPTISNIESKTIILGETIGLIEFQINDQETPLNELTIDVNSSNQNLINPAGINISGSQENRTLNLSPVSNETGTTTITLTVSDGITEVEEQFNITINAPEINNPPTVTPIDNKTINLGEEIGLIQFQIGDDKTALNELTIEVTSSNQNLIPNSNITITGNEENRTLNLSPISNETGTTTITLTVFDGQFSSQETFDIIINDASNLVSTSFNVQNDHIIDGNTNVSFTIENKGSGTSQNFTVDIYYSRDSNINPLEDTLLDSKNYQGLLGGANLQETLSISLPQENLLNSANSDDTIGLGSNHVSQNADYIGIIINGTNIIDQKGINTDDVTYFPWDINQDDHVSPTDLIFIVNRLGQNVNENGNMRADINLDNQITIDDVNAVYNRLGYAINDTVFND